MERNGHRPRGRRTILLAVAVALLPAVVSAKERSARSNYVLRCSGCHGLEGAGSLKGGIPDLRDFVGAFAADPDGRTYVVSVPGVRNSNLSPNETAAVLNYVMANFAGASAVATAPPFTAAEVMEREALAVTDVVGLRRAVAARLRAEGRPVADYPWP